LNCLQIIKSKGSERLSSMKFFVCCLVCLVAVTSTFAQQTSSSLAQANDMATTGGRARVARKLDFERKWKSIEEIYGKAGLAQDKIRKLRQLDLQAFEELEVGQRPDFSVLKAKRREIINTDDEQRIETARREYVRSEKAVGQSKTADVSSVPR